MTRGHLYNGYMPNMSEHKIYETKNGNIHFKAEENL